MHVVADRSKTPAAERSFSHEQIHQIQRLRTISSSSPTYHGNFEVFHFLASCLKLFQGFLHRVCHRWESTGNNNDNKDWGHWQKLHQQRTCNCSFVIPVLVHQQGHTDHTQNAFFPSKIAQEEINHSHANRAVIVQAHWLQMPTDSS